ncbi:MAG TPA: phosphatidylglycerophosphatase A [Firmicutes bacterium]|nr:phosphatidylglycerophosphatase A [Bacillota bacterium]
MKDLFVKILSTFFFVGYNPVLPGTSTSFVNVIIIFILFKYLNNLYFFIIPTAALLFTVIGFPVSSAAEKIFGKKDPGKVTIDEAAGTYISYSFLRFEQMEFPALVFIGIFLIFRALDMAKPWLIYSVQKLPGGSGIMMDDIIAGAAANILIRCIYLISFGVLV